MDPFERFVIREAARREANDLLSPPLHEQQQASPIGNKLARLFEDFPLFRNISITRTREAAMGRVYAKTIKSKRGHKKLRALLVMVMANPIISVLRLRDANDSNAQQEEECELPYAESGAIFLHEVCQSEEELFKLVEEFKCAFSVRELRPSLQRFIQAWKLHSAQVFVKMLRERFDECYKAVHSIPKMLLLSALKLHMHGTIAAALMTIVFAKSPLTGSSLFQQMLRVGFRLDSIQQDLRYIASLVPNREIAMHLEQHRHVLATLWEEEEDETADVELAEITLRKRDAVAASVPEKLVVRGDELNESNKWAMLRYVDLLIERDNQEALVSIFGDEDFCKQLLKELFLGKNKRLTGLLFQRGSGFVRFCEEAFECFESGLEDAKQHADSDEELTKRLMGYADRLIDRALVVLHNVLQLDNEGVIQDLLQWMFGFYSEYEKMKFPVLEEQIATFVQAEDRAVIESIAMRVRADAMFAKKPVGLPPVVLELIQRYRMVLKDQILGIQLPIPLREVPTSLLLPLRRIHGEIILIDVCWNVPTKQMTDRGFMKKGQTNSASVWAKPASSAGSGAIWPITDIDLVYDDDNEEPVWQIIPRNLNKGVWGTSSVYLRVKRDIKAKPIQDLRLIDSQSPVNQALEGGSQWQLVGSFRCDIAFSQINLWVLK